MFSEARTKLDLPKEIENATSVVSDDSFQDLLRAELRVTDRFPFFHSTIACFHKKGLFSKFILSLNQ